MQTNNKQYKKVHRGVFFACLTGIVLSLLLACEEISSFLIPFLTPIEAYGVTLTLDNSKIDVTGNTTTATMTAVVGAVYGEADTVTFTETDKDGKAIGTPDLVVTLVPDTDGLTLVLTAVAPGEAWIVATSTKDTTKKSAPTKITVNGVRSIRIVGGDLNLAIEEKKLLTAIVVSFGNTDKKVTWTSSDDTVVIVSDKGLVSATAKKGTAEITATSTDTDKSATINVITTVAVQLISLNDYSEVVQGTDAVIDAIFDGNITIDKGITYALTTTQGRSNPILPLLDDATGTITVNPNTSAGPYTITATGNGIFTTGKTLYKGSSEAIFYVTTSPTSLSNLETAIEAGIENFKVYVDLNYIKTDAITNMRGILAKDYKNGAYSVNSKLFVENFDGDISKWKVDNVENMSGMFKGALKFNQNIGNWDVSSVTNMSAMFSYAPIFNQNIGNWVVDKVENMSSMFEGNRYFDQDISEWNVANVENMQGMFESAYNFNHNIGNWVVDKVENMSSMFESAYSFNQNIGNWDVSSVANMENMFEHTRTFNQNIGDWDVSSVTNMEYMFVNAFEFNQNIGNWDVSSVTNMEYMFHTAPKFNQDLSDWNIASLNNASKMFTYSRISKLFTYSDISRRKRSNLDLTLHGWAQLNTVAGETTIPLNVDFTGQAHEMNNVTTYYRLQVKYNWDMRGCIDSSEYSSDSSDKYLSGITIDYDIDIGGVSDDNGDGIIDNWDKDDTIDLTIHLHNQLYLGNGFYLDDEIHGLGGDDTIISGWGNDKIVPGAGTDTITTNYGSDTIMLYFVEESENHVTDFTIGAGIDKDIIDASFLFMTGKGETIDFTNATTRAKYVKIEKDGNNNRVKLIFQASGGLATVSEAEVLVILDNITFDDIADTNTFLDTMVTDGNLILQ